MLHSVKVTTDPSFILIFYLCIFVLKKKCELCTSRKCTLIFCAASMCTRLFAHTQFFNGCFASETETSILCFPWLVFLSLSVWYGKFMKFFFFLFVC